MRSFRQNMEGDRGASMVEYGLIVALIALMALSAVTLLGERTDETFTTVAAELEGQGSDQNADNDSQSESEDSDDDQGGDAGDQNTNSGDEDQGDQDEDNGDDGSDGSHDQQGEDNGDDGSGDDNDDDDTGNSGDDDDNGDNAGDDNADDNAGEGNSGGDDSGDDGGSDDVGEELGESGPVASSPEAEFYWWNDTKHGGNGAWTASVSYGNDTNRHQYLDLEITRVDEKGNGTVGTHNSFYVPAGGSATYTHWDNHLEDKNGNLRGTVAVEVRVTKVRTSDQDWQDYSYDVDGEPATVAAPSTR